CQQHSTYPFTF
nr:immunoglobulin light chain junction region [Macaca mulatta]